MVVLASADPWRPSSCARYWRMEPPRPSCLLPSTRTAYIHIGPVCFKTQLLPVVLSFSVAHPCLSRTTSLILNHLASLVLCAYCSESVDALFTEAANRRMRCASAFSSAASIAPAWLSSWCSRRRYGYHTWQSSQFWASCCPCMTRPAHILSPACALLRRLIAGKVLMDRAPFAPDNLRDERWAKPSPENCVGNSSVTCSRRKVVPGTKMPYK